MNTTSSMDASRMAIGDVGKIIRHRRTAIAVFCIYLICLVYLLFFAENMGRTIGTTYRYNYIPFKEIKRFLTNINSLGMRAVIVNVVGNVVVFMPFGYLVPRIAKRKMGIFYTTILGLEFSACIELIQLVTRTGCCDVDDVILNTLGTFLGCAVYCISCAALKRKNNKHNI